MKYHVWGIVRITYEWAIDEEVEATDKDDAIDAVCDDLDTSDSFDSDTDTYGLSIDEVVAPPEPSEAERMLALGMPMLPGFEMEQPIAALTDGAARGRGGVRG